MNLAQARTLVKLADEAIDNYAGGNEAFDNSREKARVNTELTEIERVQSLPWVVYELRIIGDLYTVVLNREGDLIGSDREKVSR
jgi:hypothetical protein